MRTSRTVAVLPLLLAFGCMGHQEAVRGVPSPPALQQSGEGDGAYAFAVSFLSTPLSQAVQWIPFGNEVRIETTERWNGQDYESRYEYSTAYDIVDIAPRFANRFAILGRDRYGHDVVEIWRLRPALGGWDVDPPTYDTPIGVPVPGDDRPTWSIRGGVFVPPQERRSPSLKRTLLLRSLEIGGGRAIAFDPNGRFVLVVGTNGLFQIEVDPPESGAGGVPSPPRPPILVEQTLPGTHLATADTFGLGQHVHQGRVYSLLTFAPVLPNVSDMRVTVLIDHDNDGVFDLFDNIAHFDTWYQQYESTGSWTQTFVDYLP